MFGLIFDSHPQLAVAHEAHFVAALAIKNPHLITKSGFDRTRFLEGLEANSNFRRLAVPRSDLEKQLQANDVRDYAGGVRAVFEVYARLRGKTLYGDKTPGYVNHLGLLGGLFPEAKFVHIIRDGRDVTLSYLDRPEWGPRTIAEGAFYWRARVQRGRKEGALIGQTSYFEARYESLIEDPERTVSAVCQFLGIEFVPEMLRYHERAVPVESLTRDPQAYESSAAPLTAGLRDWRTQMAAADAALFDAIAGGLLQELGYGLSGQTITVGTRVRAGIGFIRWQARRLASKIGS